jgi:uncharacterized membrane protein YraQ (UPF0718 family)
MKGRNRIILAVYFLFVLVSWLLGYRPGLRIGGNFLLFAGEMVKILPCAFILIGLFEVWVKKETVARHLGEDAGLKGHLWAVLLAGTTVGGIYVALPVAYSLFSKKAKLGIIFTYLGASTICRVPMAIFEASILGLKFTIVRLLVSLPLVVVSSILLGNYLSKRRYQIMSGQE